MEEKWVLVRKGADFKALGEELDVDPVLVRILRNRGMHTAGEMRAFLYGGKELLHDPHLLRDADRAAELLLKKIREKKKIRIIGDYDIDGIMATYILLQGLLKLGADADTAIPDRILDGYGLNEHLITQAKESGADTILTCDNGIAAYKQIRYAKEAGMTVIVTDHHEVPFTETDGKREYRLPPADAVVDPKRPDETYPFDGICGAAVAYKLIRILYEKAGIPADEADVFLEYAGFATVGDVMDLQDENRVLVKLGLQALNRTQNLGMRTLIARNKIEAGQVRAYHIGFRIGPCLNASGRLETAEKSLRLLQTRDIMEAVPLAEEICTLNETRRDMTQQAAQEAVRIIRTEGYERDKVLVVYLADCHESLAGIVAGRLREAYNRPALVITHGEHGAKGSGRSIEAYSMYEELGRCKELFTKFGGHPMAAGFSLPEENIPVLRQRLNALTRLTDADLVPKVRIDVDLPIDYLSEQLVEELSLLEPCGKGNERPVFAQRNLILRGLKVFGQKRNVIRLDVESPGGRRMNAVYFCDERTVLDQLARAYGPDWESRMSAAEPENIVRVHLCYYPEIDDYRGNASLQLKVQHLLAG